MASEDEVGIVWHMLRAAYPTFGKGMRARELADTLSVWEQLLSDLPFELLKAAAVQHAAASKWFPAVSELRDLADTMTAAPQLGAMMAWGTVVASFGRGGKPLPGGNGYEPPTFADPITQQIVSAMGWNNIGQSENLMAERAHFLHAYEAMAQRADNDRRTLPLVRELAARLRLGAQ